MSHNIVINSECGDDTIMFYINIIESHHKLPDKNYYLYLKNSGGNPSCDIY